MPRQLVVKPQLLILRESSIGTLLLRVSQEQLPMHLLQMVTLSSLVISVTNLGTEAIQVIPATKPASVSDLLYRHLKH